MWSKLFAALLCTAAGCVTSAHAALPQSTLDACPCGCPCSTGAACTCAAGQCKCVDCPGLKAGIVASLAEAVRSSVTYGCPMIAFVNCPVQSVLGAVAYSCPQPGQPASISVGWGGYVAMELPATASMAELTSVKRPAVQAAVVQPVAYRPMEFSQMFGGGGCPGGNCGRR